MFTLAVVQEKIPSFRHNDLHTGNVILLNCTPPDDTGTKQYLSYYCGGYYYNVEFNYIQPTLIDFDLSTISKKDAGEYTQVVNDDAYDSKYGKLRSNRTLQEKNMYIDINKFSNSLRNIFNKFKDSTVIESGIWDVLNDICPPDYQFGFDESKKWYGSYAGYKEPWQLSNKSYGNRYILPHRKPDEFTTPSQVLMHKSFERFRVEVDDNLIMKKFNYPAV